MSKPRSLVIAVLVLVLGLALAVAVARGGGGGQRPPDWRAPPRDGRAMLGDVRAASLERFDRALVGFGTRHTLSSQTDPNRGIGAARDYIRDQFQRFAARSNGRMSVELQSYVQPPADRVPEPTRITNVIATLQGTDPKSADRVYVVSGHYDSRVTDVLDATSDAPGANDDGSGTSAVLELARVMASRPSEATIVFAAFAGRGAGAVRLQPLRRGRQGEGLEHPGRAQHGHRGQPQRRQRRARATRHPPLLRGRAHRRDP